MSARDPHSALKSEVLSRIQSANGLEIVTTKLWWGKDETAKNVHVHPSMWTSAGVQRTDLLSYLGFSRSDQCPFTNGHTCYNNWVSEDFEPATFAQAFNVSFGQLERAESPLNACGFSLAQPEGWGYFYGRPSGRSPSHPVFAVGDGHTAIKTESMKGSEDERFSFRFTFIDTGREKAFVTHYRPKHLPVSSEILGVFRYLGLLEFPSCPEFDFEPCFYRALALIPRGDNLWGGNVDQAHRAFDSHSTQFSIGVENLLAANATMEAVGMEILQFAAPRDRIKRDIAAKVERPPTRATKAKLLQTSSSNEPRAAAMPDTFDVAISFAGTERKPAEALAQQVRDAGFAVFYDDLYPEQLWGKNLVAFFDEIYRQRARFCVMFVSEEYRARKWTIHEARSAQARALEERGDDYILPVKVDETDLPGLPPTVGYVPLSAGIERISQMLIAKLNG